MRNRNSLVVPLLAIICISGCALIVQHNLVRPMAKTVPVVGTSSKKVSTYIVKRVVDGDTIVLESGQVVRLVGINAPESVDPNRPVQCFGKEASVALRKLLTGKSVNMEKDVSETDKYGRLLRYVWLGDVFVNDYLVQNGFAHSTTYPPDIKYQKVFRVSETRARNNRAGLWGSACSGFKG